jgi:hypothetical protein
VQSVGEAKEIKWIIEITDKKRNKSCYINKRNRGWYSQISAGEHHFGFGGAIFAENASLESEHIWNVFWPLSTLSNLFFMHYE